MDDLQKDLINTNRPLWLRKCIWNALFALVADILAILSTLMASFIAKSDERSSAFQQCLLRVESQAGKRCHQSLTENVNNIFNAYLYFYATTSVESAAKQRANLHRRQHCCMDLWAVWECWCGGMIRLAPSNDTLAPHDEKTSAASIVTSCSKWPASKFAVNWVPSSCPRLLLPEWYIATASCVWLELVHVVHCVLRQRRYCKFHSRSTANVSNNLPSSIISMTSSPSRASVPKSAEDGTVPTIVRRTSLNATKWTSQLTCLLSFFAVAQKVARVTKSLFNLWCKMTARWAWHWRFWACAWCATNRQSYWITAERTIMWAG